MEQPLQKGSRVRAFEHHWLRANSEGTVMKIDYEEHGGHPIYVEFDKPKVGRGINGCELWCNPSELTNLDDIGAKRKSAS